MTDAVMLIVFLALVAGAAEFVRARCRRQLLVTVAAARRAVSAESAVREPVSG